MIVTSQFYIIFMIRFNMVQEQVRNLNPPKHHRLYATVKELKAPRASFLAPLNQRLSPT